MNFEEKKNKLKYFLIAIPLILILGITGSGFYLKNMIYQPMSSQAEEVLFTINEGEGAAEIANKLKYQDLIKNDWVFLGFLKFKDQYSALQAGDYILNKNYSMMDTIGILTKGKVLTDKITIPEGWTQDKIMAELEKRGIATGEEFQSALRKDYDFSFLKENLETGNLEGFLFPDTYFLSSRPTAQEIIEKMLINFRERADTLIRQRKNTELSYYDVLKLASIVETEVSTKEDRQMVAGVFLNRLAIGMPLQSDATLQFILKSDKRIFSLEETKVESPYNTYQHEGLTPSPISNPGLEAIEAVLNPKFSDYLYFLSDEAGKTYYSETLEEHEQKKIQYL